MSKEIKNDKSEVKVTLRGMEQYTYMVAFNNGAFNESFDTEDKGYFLLVTHITVENGRPIPTPLLTDVKLLVKCDRRSEKNFNLALSQMDAIAEEMVDILEEDRKVMSDIPNFDKIIQGLKDAYYKEEEREKEEKDNIPSFEEWKKKHQQKEKKQELKVVESEKKEEKKKITLDSIAGHKEVKREVMEVIDAFKNKEKYEKFGIKINLNMIFEGKSGTGKTMFAKAIANECGINFIQTSGSEFVEKYAGMGAKKVRELYEDARKKAPCIVFIDEAECVLRRRTDDSNSREQGQTLNQFLVELDGMNTEDNIITICATNRIDMMDEAILRPGRLTRHITIPPLDIEGRRELLKIYAEPKPLADDVDLERIARMTSGFVGAELDNLINEACIFAVRGDQEVVTMKNFEDAYEKVSTGLKSETKRLNEKEKRITAVHEMGHALVSYLLENQHISKISVLPRNNDTLGFVLYENNEEIDSYMQSKENLENKIKSILAGKVAEKVVFNHYTSGCSNDLEKVRMIAENMVTKYGMSTLGSFAIDSTICPQEKIFEEINNIVGKCYKETKGLIKENLDLLNKLADFLYEHEEITGEQFNVIVNELRINE